MSTHLERVNEIKAQLETVTGIAGGLAEIHVYERYAAQWNDYLNLFKNNNKIHGYVITREKINEEQTTIASNEKNNMYVIRGFMSLNDSAASELDFQEIIDNIMDLFRGLVGLNGLAFNAGPPQADVIEPRMFGSVLVHYTEIRYPIQEEKQWR